MPKESNTHSASYKKGQQIAVALDAALAAPGDKSAFRQAHQRLHDWALHDITLKRVRNFHDAQDLVMRALVTLYSTCTDKEEKELSGSQMVRLVCATLCGGFTNSGKRFPGLIFKHIQWLATRRRIETPFDCPLTSGGHTLTLADILSAELDLVDGPLEKAEQIALTERQLQRKIENTRNPGQRETLQGILSFILDSTKNLTGAEMGSLVLTVATATRRWHASAAALAGVRRHSTLKRSGDIANRLRDVQHHLLDYGLLAPRCTGAELAEAAHALGTWVADGACHLDASDRSILAAVSAWMAEVASAVPAPGQLIVLDPVISQTRSQFTLDKELSEYLQKKWSTTQGVVKQRINRIQDILLELGILKEIGK